MILVRDVVGRMWGENHRPNVVVKDDDSTSAWVHAFIHDSRFWLTMIESIWEGSVGSVAIVLRILDPAKDRPAPSEGVASDATTKGGRFYAEIWPTAECQPVFKRNAPGELKQITRTYPIAKDALTSDGYDVAALEEEWRRKQFGRTQRGKNWTTARRSNQDQESWFLRVIIDENAETWFKPVPAWMYDRDDFTDKDWVKDTDRSFDHKLGETPVRWGRPIPFRHKLFPDGLCIFEPVINYQFRIDRSLSQTGRAFDYAGDPQLAWVEGAEGGDEFGEDDPPTGGTSTDIIPISKKGDAEFIEIRGEGLKVAVETYVRLLIRLAREVGGGSRIDDESKTGDQFSGVAMKMLNAALDVLVSITHVTMGEEFAIPLIRLAMRMADKVKVDLPSLKAIIKEANKDGDGDGETVEEKDPDQDAAIELSWPDTQPPTGQDLVFTVQAVVSAFEADMITHETAVANLAPYFDVTNAKAEAENVLANNRTEKDILTPPPPEPTPTGGEKPTGQSPARGRGGKTN